VGYFCNFLVTAQSKQSSIGRKCAQSGHPDLRYNDQVSPGDPSPGDPSPGDPSPGDPLPGDPSPGDPSPGDPSPPDPSPDHLSPTARLG
jgi:hypothetical protein